ncbi:MAG TPA: Rho termination factor N-terminal domain-containing protein, partial [Roseomonas sp.]
MPAIRHVGEAQADATRSRSRPPPKLPGLHSMHLSELKAKSPADLLSFAEELQIENANSMRKQDMLFAILK